MDYKEKIRHLYNEVSLSALLEDSYVAKKLEEAFPELKEESDDRIRSAILKALMTDEAINILIECGMYYEDVESWLEKKGGQKSAVEMKTPEKSLGIDSETYNEIVDECIYGKQVPADKVEPKFKVKYAGSEYNVFETKDIAGVTFYGIEDEPNHIDYVKAENCEIISGYGIKENGSPYPTKPAVFSEQSPAWSEEDEYHVKSILSTIECCKAQFPNAQAVVEAYNADIDWLKSLKDRVQLQPKQEWSEDDEQYLLICKNALTKYQTTDKWDAHIIFNWLENKLKSLIPMNNSVEWSMEDEEELEIALDTLKKAGQYSSAEWLKNVCLVPQSHWKPSEEQMKALASALSLAKNCGEESAFDLRTLYEQLEKLK